jgi:hypothetical protein
LNFSLSPREKVRAQRHREVSETVRAVVGQSGGVEARFVDEALLVGVEVGADDVHIDVAVGELARVVGDGHRQEGGRVRADERDQGDGRDCGEGAAEQGAAGD